ncbi:uncharacterized protein LOC119402508 [Rhipicephalus sanguineus]|uniref:uncharacterized protein LOC119402508 n=1 Tax=Rhipicephalus sanguineus TaxID=34632 RepID=UPI0018949FDC|nr:uncharacterized protein LOC119402508 [Rhipicephalus sanguineus]
MSTSTEQQTGSSQLTQGSGTATTHGSIQGGLQQQGGQTATGTNVSSANGIISTTEVSTSQSSAGGIIVTQVTKGQEESQKQTGIIKEGSSQTGNQGPSGGQQKPRPELKLPTIYVSKLRPPPIDKDCKVTLSYVPARRCRRPRWYYDSEKKACRPSCTKEAPFYNKIACDGVCRTLEACDFPMASIPCFFRKVHVVYIYNQWKKKCMKGYDCSYFGNKFPTLRECQQTCKLYEALRHVKNTTQSSSQVSTKREKIISTMSQQQKVSQSAISSVQGSLSSQTSHGHESTSTISSSAQLSQSAGQSATQQNSETGSGVQINGGSQHQTITGAGVGSHHSTEGETTISSGQHISSLTGGAHHNMESSTTNSFQQSSQISHSLSSSSHQINQSHTGSSAHLQIETNGMGTGAGQQNTIRGTTGSSENSIHTNYNGLTGSGQHGSSVSGSPSHSVLVGHQIVTGAGQQNTIRGTTGSSENSIHTNYNGLTGSGQHGSSVSGSPSHSVLVGHQVVTGGQHQTTTSGGSSWQTSSHISGSGTSVSHQTGSSSSGVSVGSSTHGQLQGAVETCGAPLKTALCMFDVYAMYAYDAYSGTCFMLYDCSLHGNKFPTIQTCRHACVRGAPALPGGAQVSGV